MFAKLHRFHGYNSLRGVYSNGRTVRGSQISLRYAKRAGRPYRVAVVVSRKVSKSAVVRNRIRRRVYEAVRQAQPPVPIGLDLVFTVYNEEVAEIEPPKLKEVIGSLLSKAT